MKRQLRLLLMAVQFYTRLRVPAWVGHNEAELNKATQYLPVIGWLVGLGASLAWLVGTFLVDTPTGLVLSISTSVLITGAFHEDGFADTCDGFGGGWTKATILIIMKDSRIGTYGVVGLVLLLGLKYCLLLYLAPYAQRPASLLLLLINAHTLSRFTAATFIFTHPYARTTDDSKAKPVTQQGSRSTLYIAAVLALAPLVIFSLLLEKPVILATIVPLYLLKIGLGRYFTMWIDGYTGDCLGATQQLCEVFFYLLMAIVWKFT